MATPAERDLESPTVRRVGAAASIERDAAAAQAGTMAIMISKDENKGGELARIPRAAPTRECRGSKPSASQRARPRRRPEIPTAGLSWWATTHVDRRETLGDGDL